MPAGAPVSLGTNTSAVSGTTLALTIGSSVPAGTCVVVLVCSFVTNGQTITAADNAGNTYVSQVGLTSGGDRLEFFTLLAPAGGIANGTIITATFGVATASKSIAACYVSGIASATAEATYNTATGSGVSSWSASLTTISNDDFLFAAEGNESNKTDTPDGNSTELWDFSTTDGNELAAVYRQDVAAPGTYSSGGTFSAAITGVAPVIGMALTSTPVAGPPPAVHLPFVGRKGSL